MRLAAPLSLLLAIPIAVTTLAAPQTPTLTNAPTSPALVPDKPATTPVPATQPTTAADAPQRDSSFIDAEGRAHITRIVPVPYDLSRQSRH